MESANIKRAITIRQRKGIAQQNSGKHLEEVDISED